MNDDYQYLKNQAEALRKQGQATQAIPLYEKLWQEQGDEPDKWIGWGYAHCLRKIGQSSEALEVCRDVYKIDPTFSRNNNLYGWCVYDIGIKQSENGFDQEKFDRAANAIVKITRQDQFSPYELTIFRYISHLRKMQSVRWYLVLEWTNRLNSELLSTEPNIYSDDSGKQIVSASPLEKYYAHKGKALEQLGRYEECLMVSSEAIDKFDTLHDGNEIWFARRLALSKKNLGHLTEALEDLRNLVTRKPDWFIHLDIAHIQYELGHTEDALVSASTAALASVPLALKSGVYKLLAQIMEDLGKTELSQEHLKLVALIREDQGWKQDPDIEAGLERLHVDTNDSESAKQIERLLQAVWEEEKFYRHERQFGIVAKILEHGGAGFIEDNNGDSHYFDIRDVVGDRFHIKQGIHVHFYVVDSFDNVKNRKSTKAIRIDMHE